MLWQRDREGGQEADVFARPFGPTQRCQQEMPQLRPILGTAVYRQQEPWHFLRRRRRRWRRMLLLTTVSRIEVCGLHGKKSVAAKTRVDAGLREHTPGTQGRYAPLSDLDPCQPLT